MFVLYGIWTDVMRLGLAPEEETKPDVEWWIDHQKEIEFTLTVLKGLNSTTCQEPGEGRVRDISPSNALKRLVRYSLSHYLCRHARDNHLRAALVQVVGKLKHVK